MEHHYFEVCRRNRCSQSPAKPAQNNGFLLPVLVVLCTIWSAANGQKTYGASGKHCFYCPPGTYVDDHCQEDLTNSSCAPCPPHHFSDQPNNLTHCKLCKTSCAKNSNTSQDCSPVTNRKCLCHEGFHKYPLDSIDEDWKCRPHEECREGEGEVYYGNHTSNTKCEKCQSGQQFLNRTDPKHPRCQPCMQCNAGEVFQKACSLDSNTVCSLHGDRPDTTTTAPPTTIAATTEDPLLSGGIIFVIVWGVLFVLGITAMVILDDWIRRPKRRNASGEEIEIEGWWKLVLPLGILAGGGLVVVSVFFFYRARSSSRGPQRDEEDAARGLQSEAAANGDAHSLQDVGETGQ